MHMGWCRDDMDGTLNPLDGTAIYGVDRIPGRVSNDMGGIIVGCKKPYQMDQLIDSSHE
jgi:hypothetical protein